MVLKWHFSGKAELELDTEETKCEVTHAAVSGWGIPRVSEEGVSKGRDARTREEKKESRCKEIESAKFDKSEDKLVRKGSVG